MWYESLSLWIDISKIIAPVALGLLVWFSTRKYNQTQINLSNDRLEKELFTEFNKRYDKLNEWLELVVEFESLEYLQEHEECDLLRYKLNDYFNLCAEEFYWYKKGRINPLIWVSWKKGMDSWFENHSIIREAWKDEISKYGRTAFYMDANDRLFNLE
ncbi:hypothetical protein DET49_11452 [Salegentibacter sp. 24]|uniref:hypothetical protein n=1 Tax=Salegentibacter sp. 24 TaxID=2183986 RepID=UPI00105E78A0|nr:hypothetical protein [Salegentibacter sp. 24]TDN87098.1 hypothetical protein DET49_11452 [Salegentibacter sp. 24]